jgi:pimeloyl-ACP methyl ester carboxylesterase
MKVIAFACAALLSVAFPQPAKTAGAHVIYLHGRIVQTYQQRRPRNAEFGYYELDAILETFRREGFDTVGEIRPKDASVSGAAEQVVEQVERLLASGVKPADITVVGASMGGGIALLASARLQNPQLRFAVLGVCLSSNVRAMVSQEGHGPAGHILAIREVSDEYTKDCSPWRNEPDSALGAREIVLQTGLRHGFLYRPLAAWVQPVLAWIARGDQV